MRSVQLQTALTDFLEAAAERLSQDLNHGAEIPFEVEQQPGRAARGGPSLYCYRPLTAEFIAERRGELEALPAYEPASRALAAFDGLDRYLAYVGEDVPRLAAPARVRVGIGSLLGDVFAEQSDFELRPERMRAALERLHSTALTSAAEVTILARLEGMTVTTAELPLTSGLTIAKPEALDGLPPEARAEGEGAGHLIVALACTEHDPLLAVEAGRAVLRDLLRALRLFGDGRVTLGPLGWMRTGAGPWNVLPVGSGGRPHGMLVVTTEQEDELRAFCNLVSRRAPDGNELAWALRRFELGCERGEVLEALSDNLLALRAMLEPEGPSSGMLPGRLAALCATPERRLALTERAVSAIALERAAIDGTAAHQPGARLLAEEIADHLRALLRDVICGHLDPDLVGLADELLLVDHPGAARAASDPVEPAAVGEPGESEHAPFRPFSSDPQLFGDPAEAEEILDLLI
jgi:hypothetical protein